MLNDEGGSGNAPKIDALALSDENQLAVEVVGRGISRKDATMWLRVTEKLRNELGRPVKPSDYVEFAKKRKTADAKATAKLIFRVDEGEAAGRYYELVASAICRMVRVVVSGDQTPMRMIVNVRGPDGRGYVPLREANENPDYRKVLLADMARDLRLFRVRYGQAKEWLGTDPMLGVFDLIDRVVPGGGDGS